MILFATLVAAFVFGSHLVKALKAWSTAHHYSIPFNSIQWRHIFLSDDSFGLSALWLLAYLVVSIVAGGPL